MEEIAVILNVFKVFNTNQLVIVCLFSNIPLLLCSVMLNFKLFKLLKAWLGYNFAIKLDSVGQTQNLHILIFILILFLFQDVDLIICLILFLYIDLDLIICFILLKLNVWPFLPDFSDFLFELIKLFEFWLFDWVFLKSNILLFCNLFCISRCKLIKNLIQCGCDSMRFSLFTHI